MSDKVIDMIKKRQAPKQEEPKKAPPGAGIEILSNVTAEQKSYIDGYGLKMGVLLQKIWSKYGKGPFDLNKAAEVEGGLVAACDKLIIDQFKGVLNLQEYVLVLGSLAGLQLGYAAFKRGEDFPSDYYREAGQLFEASLRVMSASNQQQLNQAKNKVVTPPKGH